MSALDSLGEGGDVVKVYSFDGQTVWFDRNTSLFEVGNFLGGGAAGNVYECEHLRSRDHFALKILNPLGYKIMSPALLRKCNIVAKGEIVNDGEEYEKVEKRNVWWLINGSTKQFVAAYFSEKQNCLKELSLVQCIQVWGSDALNIVDDDTRCKEESVEVIQIANGPRIYVPSVPPKFGDFLRRRNKIFREIRNMRKIPTHTNVIRLEGVLELTQESKCTIFLVMELANGGELFDRIKLDCGAREDTAKLFFQQLLQGVMHCHTHGVCHRDLKPENLLLQDTADNGTILKIADFGFSARFAMGDNDGSNRMEKDNWEGSDNSSSSFQKSQMSFMSPQGHATMSTSLPDESLLRVLKSVVGSPFYVAPEVLQARGYDGPKADVWSLGVILYAMLAGNLPFEQELSSCKRFRLFCKWVREQTAKGMRFWNDHTVEYPQWLFPAKFSMLAKGLIVAMLHPDPEIRISVSAAMRHPLCAAPFLGQTPVPNSAIPIPSTVNPPFSHLPVALAATTVSTNSTAVIHAQAHSLPNQLYDAIDTTVMPIASVVTAATPIVAGGVTDIMKNHQSQEQENYSSLMEIDNQSQLDLEAEEMSLPSGRAGSPSRDQDDCDDSMFFMDDEMPNDRSETSSSKEKNKSTDISQKSLLKMFKSLSDGSQGVADIYKRQREGVPPPSAFPSTSSSDGGSGSEVTRSVEDLGRESGGESARRGPGPLNKDLFGYPGIAEHGTGIPHDASRSRSIMGSGNSCAVTGYLAESPSGSMRYLSYSPQQSSFAEPPLAPLLMTSRSIDDLITAGDEDASENRVEITVVGGIGSGFARTHPNPAQSVRSVRIAEQGDRSLSSGGSTGLSATHPPSFNDSVKRSSRFITAVPACEVLDKVEGILELVRRERVQTPIGIIGKIQMHWDAYRIEVWGADTSGPPLCALQLYQMPAVHSNSPSPARGLSITTGARSSPYLVNGRASRLSPSFGFVRNYEGGCPLPVTSSSSIQSRRLSPSGVGSEGTHTQSLYLAEFVRGQLEIFAFKRFYQWVRQRLSQLVKRDYAFKLLDQGGSPMVDSHLLQRFQQCSS